jgi:hypothetical protein
MKTYFIRYSFGGEKDWHKKYMVCSIKADDFLDAAFKATRDIGTLLSANHEVVAIYDEEHVDDVIPKQ